MLFFRFECLRICKKAKLVSLKSSGWSEWRKFWIKTNCKSFREGRLVTCLASPIVYTPTKIAGLFKPAQHNTTHRQHPRSIWSTSTNGTCTSNPTVDKHNRLLYSLVDTRRRTTVRARSLGTGADVWRGTGRWVV